MTIEAIAHLDFRILWQYENESSVGSQMSSYESGIAEQYERRLGQSSSSNQRIWRRVGCLALKPVFLPVTR